MHTFPLTITALDSVKYLGEAESVTCPGAEGEMTVLKNHESLMTTLKNGIITVRGSGGALEFPADYGVLEISKKGVTILL